MSLASMLALTAKLNTFLLETKVNPTLFPYPILSTLHALRISLIYRFLTSKTRLQSDKRSTWAYDIVGFLIMCWGGGFLVNFIIGQTPVQLLSIHPFINYVGVHLFVTALLSFLGDDIINMKVFDTTFVLLDGCLRTHAVIMSILTVKNNANVQSSMLIQIICGTVGATGGGQLAGMLGVLSPSGWQFTTPPVLRAQSLVEVIDIVAAAICSIVYGCTTLSHPDYAPFLAKVYSNQKDQRPLFTPTGARAACTIVFALAFAYRATVLHWAKFPSVQAPPTKPTPKRSASPSKRSRKEIQ